MIILNYELADPECIFFNTTIHVLLEAPIWEVTENTNPGGCRMRQSEILPKVPIQNFTGFHNPECKK